MAASESWSEASSEKKVERLIFVQHVSVTGYML